ncbi:hypothetical protein VPHK469_0108 [Vibrio phage K469]
MKNANDLRSPSVKFVCGQKIISKDGHEGVFVRYLDEKLVYPKPNGQGESVLDCVIKSEGIAIKLDSADWSKVNPNHDVAEILGRRAKRGHAAEAEELRAELSKARGQVGRLVADFFGQHNTPEGKNAITEQRKVVDSLCIRLIAITK